MVNIPLAKVRLKFATLSNLTGTTQSRLKINNSEKKKDLLKTLWEKEKMLVTSILSFSHNVFYQFHSEFLNHFPNKPWFLRICSTSILKTLYEREKSLLITINFSFSHSVCLPIWRTFCHFHEI